MSGALANMLGMGVTIQLLDMFTSTSKTVSASANKLATDVEKSAKQANNAWNGMFVGGALAHTGGGIINMLMGVGKKALESSSMLEIYRNQFNLLIKDQVKAKEAYDNAIKFAVTTPFTIPQVAQSAKTLAVYGMQVESIGKHLKIAGDWAAAFQDKTDITETSRLMGQVYSGNFGRASIRMRNLGVNTNDVWAEAKAQGVYDKLFNKNGGVIRGSDGNLMVGVLDKVLSRYTGMMDKMMSTVPGMASNIYDQMIVLAASIGDNFKPRLKAFMQVILKDLAGDSFKNLGKAIGMGFDVILKVLVAVLTPLEKVVVWLGHLSEKHPAFVKWGTVMLGVAGALLFLTGTWLIWIATAKLWEMSGIVGQFNTLRTAVWAFATGPLLWIAAALALLYFAWKYNFGGMQEHLQRWWGIAKLVFEAVMEGFGSIKNGVVTFSEDTYNALEKAGINVWVINAMGWIYRLYKVFVGFGAGLLDLANGLGWFGGMIGWVIEKVMRLVDWGFRLVGVQTSLANSLAADKYEKFGYVLGWIVGLYYSATVLLKGYAAAKAVWAAVTFAANAIGGGFGLMLSGLRIGMLASTISLGPMIAATWAWTAALWANPIVWIIGAVLALVAGIVLLIVYWKEITAWFKGSPQWLQTLLMAMMPLVFIPMWIYNNWGKVKKFLAPLGAFFKGIWDDPLNWLWDKLASLTAFFIRCMVKMMQFLPDFLKPGSMKMFDGIDADKIDGKLVRNMMSNSIDAAKAARLNGSGFVGAAVAGLTANDQLAQGLVARQQPLSQAQVLQVNLDGRVLARSVFKHQAEETASGRTF